MYIQSSAVHNTIKMSWESGEMSVCKGKANQSLHGLRNISTKQCHSQMQVTASLQGHVRKKPYMNTMQKCHSDSKLIQTEVFCAKKKPCSNACIFDCMVVHLCLLNQRFSHPESRHQHFKVYTGVTYTPIQVMVFYFLFFVHILGRQC